MPRAAAHAYGELAPAQCVSGARGHELAPELARASRPGGAKWTKAERRRVGPRRAPAADNGGRVPRARPRPGTVEPVDQSRERERRRVLAPRGGGRSSSSKPSSTSSASLSRASSTTSSRRSVEPARRRVVAAAAVARRDGCAQSTLSGRPSPSRRLRDRALARARRPTKREVAAAAAAATRLHARPSARPRSRPRPRPAPRAPRRSSRCRPNTTRARRSGRRPRARRARPAAARVTSPPVGTTRCSLSACAASRAFAACSPRRGRRA